MDYIMDLTDKATDRVFVVGELLGDYDKLITLLYQQKFNFNVWIIWW